MISALLKPIYIGYEWALERGVKNNKKPDHIGVIMDGNRRLAEREWASYPGKATGWGLRKPKTSSSGASNSA